MSDQLALATRIIERAQGDEQIEAYVASGVDLDIRVYQGEVENLSQAASGGVGVRILRDGPHGARVGTAWVGSLDPEAIDEAVREARANLTFATEDEFLAFARPDGVAAAELTLTDDSVTTTSVEAKIALAVELERAVRGADPRIRQVDAADYGDYVARAAIASTTGIATTYERTGANLVARAIAGDERGDHTGWGLSVGRGPAQLVLRDAADDAVQRAVRMLGATKPATQRVTVVLDPHAAASLLGIVGGALSGEAVVRGRSFFADRVGETVASPTFTLIDDPTDPRHFAAATFDGEGLACRRNVLIEDGVLRGFVFDTVSGRRAGVASTGSAARGGLGGSPSASVRALQLTPGPLSADDVLRHVGDGVYVDTFHGIHSGVNSISGDFSVGVTGLMIRDGQLAEPIREATIASTLQRMLLDVVAIGADVTWLPGHAAGQTLAISGVALSGS